MWSLGTSSLVLIMRSFLKFCYRIQVNLAAADVLIALCCMWPHLVNDLTKPAFVLGAFMCKFNAFAQSKSNSSFLVTTLLLCCISPIWHNYASIGILYGLLAASATTMLNAFTQQSLFDVQSLEARCPLAEKFGFTKNFIATWVFVLSPASACS